MARRRRGEALEGEEVRERAGERQEDGVREG